MSTLKVWRLVIIVVAAFALSPAQAHDWTVERDNQTQACRALSPEGLGVRVPDDRSSIGFAFFGADAPEGSAALVQSGTEYAYLSIAVWTVGGVTGLEASDFHLLDSMATQGTLYILFGSADGLTPRLFDLRTDDCSLKYSLAGFAEVVAWLYDCRGAS